ncbi:MAG: HAMP domain-containing protein [Proteobacteria bacterium]|nr:HAMP domain-containing protein [Pseudomonadota bacterium]MBU1581489.1 HAMP domain-containing protein [Pseudomonadota bacterium]MBU2455163.1 HAMP domain-containing protein [Pseudomonadota bacterium]MBU2628872.1 HAMP domain-containing protein [Pseudomonadota bacterium]
MYKIINTIAFRLTLWFTGIFTICAGVAFVLFYLLAAQTLQTQIDQELLDNSAKFSAIIHRNGLMGARELAVVEAQAAGEKLMFFRLVYPTGEVFASSHMSYWKDVHVSKNALRNLIVNKTHLFETILIPSSDQKARILYSYVAANAILQTGIAMDSYEKFLTAFKKVFVGAMGFIIIFSALSGWLLIRKALSGVATITKTAENITGNTLEARVPGTGSKDELDHLVITFNSMLDRIEELVKSIREMSDNIAHDLKSPITRIRGFAELALVHEDNLEDYRNMASSTIEESDRLLDMINTMLVISKAEAGEGEFEFKRIHLSKMIKEACDLFAPLAEDKQIRFFQTIQDQIYMDADIRMLQRAFSNVLDNAIKYTPENGEIRVIAELKGDESIIRIQDTGIGIAPKYFEKIFERFYRAESSRTSAGTGLGLSLARTIVRQHKGDISVSSIPGKGAVFVITLPYRNFEVI